MAINLVFSYVVCLYLQSQHLGDEDIVDQEFKVNFSYVVSLRPAWAIGGFIQQNKTKQNQKKTPKQNPN